MARASARRRWRRCATAAGCAGALVVLEEATLAKFVVPEGFEELERRAYDDTEFRFCSFPASIRRGLGRNR